MHLVCFVFFSEKCLRLIWDVLSLQEEEEEQQPEEESVKEEAAAQE